MAQQRWAPQRARGSSDQVGWLVGCNLAPSAAGNQLEMWRAATFDPDTFERELGWASELGITPFGPPQVEGGPPHFMNGMYAEITVTG